MEPITATLTAAKEIYETAKTIQKVYNVSKEMKTVAESEGKDQIMATKDLAGTAANLKNEGKADKPEAKGNDIEKKDDLQKTDSQDMLKTNGHFVDRLDSLTGSQDKIEQPVEFVDKLTEDKSGYIPQIETDVYVDKLSTTDNSDISVSENVKTNANVDSPTETTPLEQEVVESNAYDVSDQNLEKKPEGLTPEEKQEIKDKTGWSDKIVDAIRTKEEAQIYMDAELVEGEINGKPALIQPKIDGKACNDSKWPDWNNKDLAEEGYPPRDENGRPYELHHIGQNPDSPLAELTYEQHHCNGNFKTLHTFDESNIDRTEFNKERREYWEERSKTL